MVAGIAGQGDYGAQSVVLSGGYIVDEDHGEWFIYTGSGGKDLTGNKRTNSQHSSDQTFTNYNQALRLSCLKGYPVRVVRSYKEKRSSYAPAGEKELRYDGVYKIEKCWRKVGKQGFKVCRYLFVRCDNEPAPWTSDDHGDRPRPLPIIVELENGATDVTESKGSPSWDYDEETKCWTWKNPRPRSKQPVDSEELEDGKKGKRVRGQGKRLQEQNMKEKVLREFKCDLCRKIMLEPVTTPCGHNFCRGCLQGAFAGVSLIKQRTCQGRRTLRAQKNVMKCPNCPQDIAEFLQNPQVNKSLENAIELLQQKEEDVAEKVEDVEKDDEAEQTYNASEDTEAEVKGADEQKINPSHKRKKVK